MENIYQSKECVFQLNKLNEKLQNLKDNNKKLNFKDQIIEYPTNQQIIKGNSKQEINTSKIFFL